MGDSEYMRGYIDGLKGRQDKKAVTYAREINPEKLDYSLSGKEKAKYATDRNWGEFSTFLEDAQRNDCSAVAVAFPEVLGDNYFDVMVMLSLIAKHRLVLGIAGVSPFIELKGGGETK